jgi:transcriptional regulator with XRE-family HTH domain
LRDLRLDRLLTVRELAQQAGVAPGTVYLTEIGRSCPGFRVIRRLATVLTVEPWEVEEFRQRLATYTARDAVESGG